MKGSNKEENAKECKSGKEKEVAKPSQINKHMFELKLEEKLSQINQH